LARKPLLLVVVSAVLAVALQFDIGWRKAVARQEISLPTPTISPPVLMALPPQLNFSVGAALTPTPAVPLPQVMVEAMAITVDGRDVVAVASEEVAAAVRDALIFHYRETVLKDASEIEQIRFQEKLAWRPKTVPRDNIRSLEEAVSILRVGTDKVAEHIVRSGDTAWDIASRYGVSLERLSQANPGVNLELLSIGQTLSVTFTDPYIHTQSVSLVTYQEGIPFTEEIIEDLNLWPWQYELVEPGRWGRRELTVRITRDGTTVVKREVVTNKVLSEPRRQLAKKGTRLAPNLGTGQLHFPVNGTLTSPYGPRWGGYHRGVDLGAPMWAPIYAADSGMVVTAGWWGNYGRTIKIDHGEGRMVTLYAHLADFNVALGQTVKKGELIGWVGNSGLSTGPHLHFEVIVNGEQRNPLDFYQGSN
jgi:murein DD-endopeptidase MepM/ murein hydrolase activator NlpD